MTKKRAVILLIVAALLGTLVYLQFRTWQKFDWHTFARVTKGVDPYRIGLAVLIIYATYVLRAVRWKIFLRPVRKTSTGSMVGPQFIGFTGLALLGRPGELIRPYLIAKKENLTFSSQVAVWAVERIFDIGAFAVLMAIDVFAFSGRFALPPDFHVSVLGFPPIRFVLLLKIFGGMLLAGVGFLAWVAYKIRANTNGVALWVERKVSPVSRKFANSLRHKVHAFGTGLNTIHDQSAFIQLVSVSLAIWFLIALAYQSILNAYPEKIAEGLHNMQVQDVLLLMGASMVGSLLQLPAVGGGSQLATIGVMSAIFLVPQESAVSAGMMLWLVTFVSCIPAGFFFAHKEHVSLRKVTEESQIEEENAEAMEGQ